jgi:hypothetical protein
VGTPGSCEQYPATNILGCQYVKYNITDPGFPVSDISVPNTSRAYLKIESVIFEPLSYRTNSRTIRSHIDNNVHVIGSPQRMDVVLDR